MPKPGHSNSSLIGWMAVVTVPLVVLAIIAGLGIRALKEAARSRALDEAAVVSASQADRLSQQLRSAIREFPPPPDPPLPGRNSRLEQVLDSSDLKLLARLRDNPEAGNSKSGLPLRVLAALRIETLAPGKQDHEELIDLLTREAYSVLTLPALRRLQARHPDVKIPEVWQLLADLDELGAAHPVGGWITFQGRPWWISADGRRFLPPNALDTETLELPAYAATRFSSNGQVLTAPEDGEILAIAPVDFPSPLRLDWILSSPEALAATTHQQTRWFLTLLAGSLVTTVVGLVAILRMVRGERRLARLKGQFVASVSHELRAPIGTIRLMSDALEAGRVDEPREFHHMISRESERLSHLIENVLDFARIEEGRRHYQFHECELSELIRETAEVFTARAADTGHRIQLALSPGRATVDRGALQQATANLLDNAFKFSPPGSTVTIGLAWDDRSWSLTVTDEGPGIPEAERKRVFDRFHRLGDEMRRETTGTGIGLSLVQHIAEAHGGTVEVTNEPTTFTLKAPLVPPASS